VYKLKERYNDLVDQLPDLCVPACLEMIFKRRNMDISFENLDPKVPVTANNQIKLASYLNFSTSQRTKNLYPYFNYESNHNKQGCKVTSLNSQLFRPLSISLLELYFTVDYPLKSNIKLIQRIIDEDDDMIISYDDAVLRNVPNKTYRHTCILENIEGDDVHLIIPSESKGTIRVVKDVRLLFQSMQKIKGGIWNIISI